MSRARTIAIESFKQSLRLSLLQATKDKTEDQIRKGEFFCTAPIHELVEDLEPPKTLELLVDFDFDFWNLARIWFDLVHVWDETDKWGNELAVYHATCG